MHSYLPRLSKRHLLTVIVLLVLSTALVVIGTSERFSRTVATPVAAATIEETLANRHAPSPVLPGDPLPLGWTAWSG